MMNVIRKFVFREQFLFIIFNVLVLFVDCICVFLYVFVEVFILLHL
jgi:hypothetical protein